MCKIEILIRPLYLTLIPYYLLHHPYSNIFCQNNVYPLQYVMETRYVKDNIKTKNIKTHGNGTKIPSKKDNTHHFSFAQKQSRWCCMDNWNLRMPIPFPYMKATCGHSHTYHVWLCTQYSNLYPTSFDLSPCRECTKTLSLVWTHPSFIASDFYRLPT